MELKEFFLSLVRHSQKVEIYYNNENRDDIFGFKINGIDSYEIWEMDDKLNFYSLIEEEIRWAFIDNSGLVNNGEGDTSYFLQPNFTYVKSAKYFDWDTETEQFWIEENETEFDFENINLPFDRIFITKELDSVKIDEEKTLKNILSKELYKKFVSFYKELLGEFQEMEIQLELELNEENNLISSILQMDGSYTETIKFTLLDASVLDIPIDNLKEMLVKFFKIDEQKASLILS